MDQPPLQPDAFHRIEEKLMEIAIQVQRIESSMMSRSEVEAETARRVHIDTFNARMMNVDERIKRLEGGPRTILAWGGAGVGCLSMLIAAAALVFGIVMALLGR